MLDVSVLYTILFCGLLLILAKKWKGSTLRYPPGPKGYPILGNVLDLPPNVPLWETLTSLTNRQGTDILYLRLLNNDIIVLSSNEAISELLDGRSGIYADRPQTTMVEMTGTTEWAIVFMPYGDGWRARRKLCHEALNIRLAAKFDDHQYKYTYQLLSRLLDAPERFMEEVEFMPGATMMSVTYGIDVRSTEDPFFSAMMDATNALTAVTVPGKFLADIIPILRYVPDWFPGAGFKVLAKGSRDKYKISVDGPMEYVKNAMKSGENFSQSITSDCLSRLEDHKKIDFDEGVIRDVSGTMFGVAAETTKSLLHTFFLVMILNPEARKKAQEELDRVVGKNRLPEFSDKENLPYIDALMKELLRWSPPLPFSVPTRVTQDDVYRGYFIPEGATVIQNVWAIFRDPSIYPDPETFNPDRFLKDGKINPLVLNPEDRAFGAGRRICPGRHFALRTAYLVITCVLSVFNVEPALDDNGNPQVPKAEYESSLVRNPKPFKCTIKPRSKEVVGLVEENWDRMNC